MKKILILAISVLCGAHAYSAEKAPYTEGPVTEVSFIRTKPGMFDAYVKWLGADYKALNEEYKKAGFILSYNVYAARPRHPDEADIILTVTYANMAALDNFDDKTSSIDEKVIGSRTKAAEASIDREKLRTVLGSELIQQLILP